MLHADDLRFFLEVARTGRLISAGKGLGVDHTTVGRRITALERAIGARLFDRVPSGWTVTDAGQSLLVHAEAVESAVLAAIEAVGSAPGRLSGTVRIATPDGFGAFVLLPGLGRMRALYPSLTVEVVTATRLNSLATREFDVGVTLEKPSSRSAEVYGLADYRLRLYATPQYLDSRPPIAAVEDLRFHDLIGYVDGMLDVPALRIFDSLLPEHHLQIQTNNISGQWLAAAAGLGVALLPEYIAEPDQRLVSVLAEQVAVTRRYWVVVPRELQRLGRTRAAQAALRALVADHPRIYPC